MKKPVELRLQEIRSLALHGEGHGSGSHGGHGGHGREVIPHVEGANPLMDDYLKPQNPQGWDTMPGKEDKRVLPMYLPAASHDIQDNGKPINTLQVMTRGELMNDVLSEDYKNGSPGAVYRAYFMSWLCVGLTILALSWNVYLAGVLAYLAGYYWSEKDLSIGWSIQWWKGKTITYTQ